MPVVTLHQWEISPFCGKVRKVLTHKGIKFSVVNYNGLLATKASKLSSAGKLPVLDFDGERIQDSSSIVAFLESRVPQSPLLPKEPAQRAKALILEDWADESLYWYEIALRMGDPAVRPKAIELLCTGRPALERLLVGLVIKYTYPKKMKAQGIGLLPAEKIHEQLLTHIASLEELLLIGPWLVGDEKSIADIAVSAQIDEIVRTSPLAPRVLAYPRVREWLTRCA